MILHFSHIGLTDGRTFMVPFGKRSALEHRCRYAAEDARAAARARQQYSKGSGAVLRRVRPWRRRRCLQRDAPEAVALALVPRRQDPRPVGGDRDRELEVRGQRAVLGEDRPAVVAHAHRWRPAWSIGSTASTMPSSSSGPRPGVAVVGDLRLLVHVAADAVADERADDRQALPLDARLHRVRDVAQAVARPALLDGVEQRRLGDVQQLAGDRRDRARPGTCGPRRRPSRPGRRRRRSRSRRRARACTGPGMPWTTIELGEAQIEPGKPR